MGADRMRVGAQTSSTEVMRTMNESGESWPSASCGPKKGRLTNVGRRRFGDGGGGEAAGRPREPRRRILYISHVMSQDM